MWKHKDILMIPAVIFPTIGTILAAVFEVSHGTPLLYVIFSIDLKFPRPASRLK